MRRQGQYSDSGANAYGAARMQHMSSQRMEQNSGHFQGQLEAFTPEREPQFPPTKTERQWTWERDGSKVPNPMASQMFNEGQGVDASGSFFQGLRADSKLALEKQNNSDPRSRPHEEDVDVGHEGKPLSNSLEGLEQKFIDDVKKLAKEQNDAEDAENARHREKLNAINAQYVEQLAALRARHASRRDEFLRKESHARQQQYQQAMMEHYPDSMGPGDPLGYSGTPAAAAVGETYRPYNSDHYDSHKERARFLGGPRDHGFEPRGPYPGGRVYDTGSRYY
ncbi:uncharacterized protein LOC123224707 [Mangifera indica]|uniref:uncharacterized protein LOC123224707 n=1 Tax=Mangifera indica TaxID=29780 RepID=UPI001CFA64DA|nr:uncharacterized protein LOC123224707 [Mangifera indica]XP_044504337.1 uncharacterized protein LOC123224707 [Mangifera indica]